jgi:hypothetical protein
MAEGVPQHPHSTDDIQGLLDFVLFYGGGGGGGAPATAPYLTLAVVPGLTSERVLTPGLGLTGNDLGAGSTYTLDATTWTHAPGVTSLVTLGDQVVIGAALPIASEKLRVVGDVLVSGTTTTAVVSLADPAAGTTIHLESADGQTALVSAVNTGRIRYNAVSQTWQASMNGAPYVDITVGGGGGTATILRIPFTFASGTLVLYGLTPGMIVSPCYVRISTIWDTLGGTLQVGTPSNPTALLAAADVNLYTTGRYDAQFDFQAALAENLQLVIGGPLATAGSGYVLFTVG